MPAVVGAKHRAAREAVRAAGLSAPREEDAIGRGRWIGWGPRW
ncbi:hypothetical protein APASM_1537 [Actinosynnema pretiosum subsp. pretiosum]|nr:hypothetical protein APASM_1537 [Actinosynnema pretiosum subsp. pretiosum]